MAERRTYRHKVTGLVSDLDPMTARGMGDVLEEVRPDAKPLVPLQELQEPKPGKRPTKKEPSDG